MQGLRELRSKESDEFVRFFEIVRKRAAERGCLFFVDSGEGRNIIDGDMELSDLSGWLIPFEDADKFETVWKTGNEEDIPDKWFDHFMFAEWKKTANGIDVSFVSYG